MDATIPMNKHPITLTKNVCIGNANVFSGLIASPTPYLNKAPTAPPSAM